MWTYEPDLFSPVKKSTFWRQLILAPSDRPEDQPYPTSNSHLNTFPTCSIHLPTSQLSTSHILNFPAVNFQLPNFFSSTTSQLPDMPNFPTSPTSQPPNFPAPLHLHKYQTKWGEVWRGGHSRPCKNLWNSLTSGGGPRGAPCTSARTRP